MDIDANGNSLISWCKGTVKNQLFKSSFPKWKSFSPNMR